MNGYQHDEDFWAGISGKAAIDIAWPRIEHFVEDILKYSRGEHTKQDVYDALIGKQMQLWVIGPYDGICITEVATFPQLTCVNVFGFAGISMERGLNLLKKVLIPWAQEQGATVIRDYSGRRGAVKQLIKDGWEEAYYVMELKL